MAMLGSPEMTVRAEKSTRLPMRLPLTRPAFPFKRWPIDNNGRPDRCIQIALSARLARLQRDPSHDD